MKNIKYFVSIVLAYTLCSVAAKADFRAGWEAYLAGDFTTAINEWKPLAEQGNVDAQYSLGGLYDKGMGVPEDDVEAVKWYRLAAEQGYDEAQYNLGVQYADGTGVPEDDVEAVKWFSLAAEQGHATAQYYLALMYFAGTGISKDLVYAYKWFNLAAAQGEEQAIEGKKHLNENLTQEQITEAQKLSREWIEEHQ